MKEPCLDRVPVQDCEDPCPNAPIGFAANAQYISQMKVSDIIGGPSDNKLRTEGRATATSLISQADAKQKALDRAKQQAAFRMRALIDPNFTPNGEWIV